jgi:hypothetical protein
MLSEPAIFAVRGLFLGTSVISFAFAAVSIPIPDTAAMTPPALPPPVKIVYRTASNPFRLDYIGQEAPMAGTTQLGRGQSAPGFPSLPNGMNGLPKGAAVPGVDSLTDNLELTGIVMGTHPLALVKVGEHIRTVGVGDKINGVSIRSINESNLTLANGEQLIPGAVHGTASGNSFTFPSTLPNGENKGQLAPTVADPNAPASSSTGTPAVVDPNAAPPQPAVPTPSTAQQQQSNFLQQLQNLAPAQGAPGSAGASTPPNATSPTSAMTAAPH